MFSDTVPLFVTLKLIVTALSFFSTRVKLPTVKSCITSQLTAIEIRLALRDTILKPPSCVCSSTKTKVAHPYRSPAYHVGIVISPVFIVDSPGWSVNTASPDSVVFFQKIPCALVLHACTGVSHCAISPSTKLNCSMAGSVLSFLSCIHIPVEVPISICRWS